MTNITISDSTTFYKPVLEIFRNGKEYRNYEIIDEIKKIVPDDEKDNAKVKEWVGFSIKHFYDSGCLEKIENGLHRITDDGIKLLNKDYDSLDRKVLMQECPKFREKYSKKKENESVEEDGEDMDDEITFDNALKIINEVLEQTGTTLTGDYDMALVKKLPNADIIPKNKTTNKGKITHIALTNEKMDIFPFLESFDYFYNEKGKYNTNSKVRFLLKVPINLYSSNLKYLDINDEFGPYNEEDVISTTATIVRNRKNVKDWSLEKLKRQIDNLEKDSYKNYMKLLGYDIQAELSSNLSGEEFIDFRKLLYENYYLIILKYINEFKYDIFAVLPDDGQLLDKIDYELYTINKKTISTISVEDWATDKDSKDESLNLWSVKIDDDGDIEDGGRNILIYGVPGSGKSWTIKHDYIKDTEDFCKERVVFHPDYTYSDFVGQILPQVSEENVSYDFIEGPFTSILMKACANPSKKFYLIIEEINRGNAPAIFGDIFQLLDRKTEKDDYPKGTSEYAITNTEISKKVYKSENHKIRIPPNLSIIATMNTADQNVFTLDTAFQRRWDMRLIPNKFKEDHKFANDNILDTTVKWYEFVNYINGLILSKNNLITSSEDKRLGVYFVQREDLKDPKDSNNHFAEKVLKYLWDDAFKFSRKDIFNDSCKSLEDLIDEFTSSKGNNRFNIFKNKEDLINYKNSDDENGES